MTATILTIFVLMVSMTRVYDWWDFIGVVICTPVVWALLVFILP